MTDDGASAFREVFRVTDDGKDDRHQDDKHEEDLPRDSEEALTPPAEGDGETGSGVVVRTGPALRPAPPTGDSDGDLESGGLY